MKIHSTPPKSRSPTPKCLLNMFQTIASLFPCPLQSVPSNIMFCGVNLSQLGPEDVHCTQCVRLYSLLLHFSSILSTASFLFTAHTVLTKSTPLMAMYRLYLLNCLCWGYLYSLFNSQIQFVILAPVIANYMHGQLLPGLFHHLGLDFHLFLLAEVCFCNYIVGLLLLLLHRFVYFGPHSNSTALGRALRSPLTLLCVIVTSTMLSGLADWLILHLLENGNDQEQVQRLGQRFPQLKPLFQQYRVMGLSGVDDFKHLALFSSLTTLSFFFGLILANLGLHLKRSRNVRKLSSSNNSHTLRLMSQLYRMNTVQIMLIGLLLTGPFLIGTSITAYKCRFSHHFWLVAIWLSSLHCSLDSLVILLYIRPYREHLHSILRRCLWCRKNQQVTVQVIAKSIEMPQMALTRLRGGGERGGGDSNGMAKQAGPLVNPRVVYFAPNAHTRRNTAPIVPPN